MKYFVFSTLSTSMIYQEWLPGGGDLPIAGRKVLIRGGAGVANKHIITPKGVMTEVTEGEVGILKNDKVFQLHERNGFVRVESKAYEVERVVPDMEAQDESAPLTPADFTDPNAPAPAGVDVDPAPPVSSGRRGRRKKNA